MKLSITLDSAALERQLGRLAARGTDLAARLVNRLTMMGEEYAKLCAPVDSGELRGAISALPEQITGTRAVGGLVVRSDHAGFVEYGTGAPGAAGAVANGQPRDPRAAGFTYTLQTVVRRRKAYTRSTKTGRQVVPPKDYIIKGWIYYDPVRQRFVHTLGQAARPFMYPATLFMRDRAGAVAAALVRDTLGV